MIKLIFPIITNYQNPLTLLSNINIIKYIYIYKLLLMLTIILLHIKAQFIANIKHL